MLCFVLNSYLGFTQGNLQFNQVKLVTTVETVPTGKVWKIESVTYSAPIPYMGSSSAGTDVCYVKINANNQIVRSFSFQYNGGAAVWEQSFPIWLPAGTTLAAFTGVNLISVMEFNIVP
jgi:hypothetical protein